MRCFSRSLGFLRRKGKELARSESGQALIFGALTLFMLASFVIFVTDSGMVTSARIEVQNAADECAYSGALYEANVISSVAYMNEAMAWMYYDALRYAVDTAVTGVFNSLHEYRSPPFKQCPLDIVYNDQDQDQPGLSGDPQANYDRAYDRARENIPQIERTLNMFARWEWGMALASGELVKMEMNRVALRHGIEAMAIYPDIDFSPANGVQFDLHILRIFEGSEVVGWRVWTDGPPPFYIEARRLGSFHWLITDTNRNAFEIERIDPTTYRIQTSGPTMPDVDITVNRISDTHVVMDMTTHDNSGTTTTHIDARYLDGLGWAVAMHNDNFDITYTPFRDGGYTITVNGQSAGIRRDPATGHIQQWNGSTWADVPGQRDTVTVGGVQIPVQMDQTIQLGPDTSFTIPNVLHLRDVTYIIPSVFQLPNCWVTMLDDSVRIDAFMDIPVPRGSRRLRFTIEESNTREMTLYGILRTYNVPRSADCKWTSNREGTERDRLCRDCQLTGDCSDAGPADDETHFTYQYRFGNPYFIKEDPRRFAHHALCDRDPTTRAHYEQDGTYYEPKLDWTRWYDIAQGAPRGDEYWQIRKPWPGGGPPNYDSNDDLKNDAVRIRILRGPDDVAGLSRDDTRQFDPYYTQVDPWAHKSHDVAQGLINFPGPLRLSEDFFFYGLTVGCWRSARQGGQYPFTLFRNPEWGVVAASSARAGFLETRSDTPDDPAPHYRFTWPTTQQIQEFVAAGYEDLYEPIWTAHLWPMTDAIRDDHIHAYVENQTGLSYLFTGLLNAIWYEPRPPERIGEEPRRRDDVNHALRSMHLNPDDPRLGEVLLH